ncbi:MAG: NAD(P)H-dependent oxidoreductase [Sphingobacterium sp.]
MALVILAHPNFDKSFANKAIIEELKKSDLELEIRNLHELYPDFKIDPKAEQEALLRHQTIVFQYPFYWLNIPSILKQWFDIVFEHQFAYGSKGDKLKNKNFLPSFTVGSPEEAYRPLGKHHFRIHEFCKNIEQTAYYAQMNYIEPIYFHGTSLVVGYTEEEVKNRAKDHANRLIRRLQELK